MGNLRWQQAGWQKPDEKARAVANIMRLYLQMGDRQKPDVWLETVQVDSDNLTLVRLDEYLAYADVLRFSESAQAREDGLQILAALYKLCNEAEFHGVKIEVFCLQALLMVANDEESRFRHISCEI